MTLLSTAIENDHLCESCFIQLIWYMDSANSIHFAVFVLLKKYIFIDIKFNISKLVRHNISKKH